MAQYAEDDKIERVFEWDFFKDLSIGSKPRYPGIYKCKSCGYEDVINRQCETLPPCNGCKKSSGWNLIVKAEDS